MPGNLHGFRPEHSTLDVYWRMSLEIERATVERHTLRGFSLDIQKCFNSVLWSILFPLLKPRGYPLTLLRLLETMYVSLWCRFRTGDHVGEPFVATNGILQGCPLSVMLITLLTSVWADTMRLEAPLCVLRGYTDDIGVYTTANREFLCQGADVMSSLLVVSGLRPSVEPGRIKCWFWSTADDHEPIEGRRVQTCGVNLPTVRHEICVLAGMPTQNIASVRTKAKSANLLANRLGTLCKAIPFRVRSQVAGALVLPSVLYGYEVFHLLPTLRLELDRNLATAVWGRRLSRGSKDIITTVMGPSHRLNTRCFMAYQCLAGLYRMCCCDGDLRELVAMTFDAVRDRTDVSGPLALLCELLHDCGGTWHTTEHRLSFGDLGDVSLAPPSAGDQIAKATVWAMHIFREVGRHMVWSRIERSDMGGLQSGIDQAATNAHWVALAGSERYTAGVIRGVLSSSIWTRMHLANSGSVGMQLKGGDGHCEHCRTPDHSTAETIPHIFWGCPAWDDVHTDFPNVLASAEVGPGWPDCVRWCGILPTGTLLAPAEGAQFNQRLLGDMQYMYAHILEAHMRAEGIKFAAAQLSTGRDTVSWEWSPGARVADVHCAGARSTG